MSSGEHVHPHAHGDDGPPGGVGWIILDAIVCATAAALFGLFAEWLYREYRARKARAALAEMGGPDGRPLVDLDALARYLDQQGAGAGGQGHPDPGPATGDGDTTGQSGR